MAPEIYKQEGYNYPVDVWAIGCLLFEMLTNDIPFPARNLPEITNKIIYQPPAPFP